MPEESLQPSLFNEAEAEPEEAEESPGSDDCTSRHPALPRLDRVHDLAEADQVCPQGGIPLERMGEALSE